jgi:hypothetical protein
VATETPPAERWRIICEVKGDPPKTDEEPEPKPEKPKGRLTKTAKEEYEEEVTAWEERERQKAASAGGMIIHLVHVASGAKEEVSRVGFNRSLSAAPEKTFKDVFEEELDKAKVAAKALNEQFAPQSETML